MCYIAIIMSIMANCAHFHIVRFSFEVKVKMKIAKRVLILILILLLSVSLMPTALAVEDSSSGTGDTTTNEGGVEGNTSETEEKEPPETVYIYIENSTIDYSVLNRQIAIANGLRESDYTSESWAVLKAALDTALYAQDSSRQDVVDNAAEALRVAISELVSMDFSKLEQAIHTAKGYLVGEEYELVIMISNLIKKAEGLFASGDQEAVDACAEEINLVIAQYISILPEDEEPEIIVKEVQVEVPPSDDFCNISKHYLWPILFFISLGVNLLLVGAIVLIFRRRKLLGQDVPLVDYDIDDDM